MNKLLFLLISIFSSYNLFAQELSVEEIVKNTVRFYDPQAQWKLSNFSFELDEPRLKTPQRHSQVILNNKSKELKITRYYLPDTIVQGVDQNAHFFIFNGQEIDLDNDTIRMDSYRTSKARVEGMGKFYSFLLGMPHNLPQIKDKILISHANSDIYILEIELSEPIISKKWRLYIDKNDFYLKKMETSDNEFGEIIIFSEETAEVKGIKFPRFRHWYNEKDNAYLGSDIIVLVQ